ncbi:hypothetical protein HC928_14515, partial [bacterium]|nr:hypothetical protein [bacterium]
MTDTISILVVDRSLLITNTTVFTGSQYFVLGDHDWLRYQELQRSTRARYQLAFDPPLLFINDLSDPVSATWQIETLPTPVANCITTKELNTIFGMRNWEQISTNQIRVSRLNNTTLLAFTPDGIIDEIVTKDITYRRMSPQAPLGDAATITLSGTIGNCAPTEKIFVTDIQASQTIVSPMDTVTFTVYVTATGTAATAVLTNNLSAGLTYVPDSLIGAATYYTNTNEIRLEAPLTTGDVLSYTYQATVLSSNVPGSLINNSVNVSGADYLANDSVTLIIPDFTPIPKLVLIYAAGDNDLSEDSYELLNKAQLAADNPHVKVLAVVDGFDSANAYLYHVQTTSNTATLCPSALTPVYSTTNELDTICGSYKLGENLWQWSESTSVSSLSEFLSSAMQAHPNAEQVIVSLVGHGGGWSPSLQAGQPKRVKGQPSDPSDTGFMIDDTPGASLSTRGLSEALRQSVAVAERKIDLLYLDACFMGTIEVAYELRDTVDFLLASESWGWAAFPYDQYLNAITASNTPEDLAKLWLEINDAELAALDDEYPRIYAAFDLAQTNAISTPMKALAQRLNDLILNPDVRDETLTRITDAYSATEKVDINLDGKINDSDHVGDMDDFLAQLAIQFADDPLVTTRINEVHDVLAATLVDILWESGSPWTHPNETWEWNRAQGLSLFLPLIEDHWLRGHYTSEQLEFVRDTEWDKFLATYHLYEPAPEQYICPETECSVSLAPQRTEPRNISGDDRIATVIAKTATAIAAQTATAVAAAKPR